jgi:hypothetical protein
VQEREFGVENSRRRAVPDLKALGPGEYQGRKGWKETIAFLGIGERRTLEHQTLRERKGGFGNGIARAFADVSSAKAPADACYLQKMFLK